MSQATFGKSAIEGVASIYRQSSPVSILSLSLCRPLSREAESMPPIFMVEPAPLVDVAASRHSHQIPRKFKCAASPRLSAFMASISPNYRPFQDRSYCCLLVRWFAPNWWSLVDCCPSKRSSAFGQCTLAGSIVWGRPYSFCLGLGVGVHHLRFLFCGFDNLPWAEFSAFETALVTRIDGLKICGCAVWMGATWSTLGLEMPLIS